MRELVRHIAKQIYDLRDAKATRELAMDVLRNSRTLLDVVETAGYKLNATEQRFFQSIPRAVGGAVKGVLHDSVDAGTRVNFDVAYLGSGTGFTLTVSAPARGNTVDVVLVAPTPELAARGKAALKSGASRRRSGSARTKGKAKPKSRSGAKRKR